MSEIPRDPAGSVRLVAASPDDEAAFCEAARRGNERRLYPLRPLRPDTSEGFRRLLGQHEGRKALLLVYTEEQTLVGSVTFTLLNEWRQSGEMAIEAFPGFEDLRLMEEAVAAAIRWAFAPNDRFTSGLHRVVSLVEEETVPDTEALLRNLGFRYEGDSYSEIRTGADEWRDSRRFSLVRDES